MSLKPTDNVTYDVTCYRPAQEFWVTVCARNGAQFVNLDQDNFELIQAGKEYYTSLCQGTNRKHCDYNVSIDAPGCYDCILVFDVEYNGEPRTLRFTQYGEDGESIRYEASVDF